MRAKQNNTSKIRKVKKEKHRSNLSFTIGFVFPIYKTFRTTTKKERTKKKLRKNINCGQFEVFPSKQIPEKSF